MDQIVFHPILFSFASLQSQAPGNWLIHQKSNFLTMLYENCFIFRFSSFCIASCTDACSHSHTIATQSASELSLPLPLSIFQTLEKQKTSRTWGWIWWSSFTWCMDGRVKQSTHLLWEVSSFSYHKENICRLNQSDLTHIVISQRLYKVLRLKSSLLESRTRSLKMLKKTKPMNGNDLSNKGLRSL